MIKRLIGEDVDVKLNLAGDLPVIEADPAQVQQVFLNLAVNARDAMPRGGSLTVETGVAEVDSGTPWLARGLAPGRFVLLSVSDTGAGMDEGTRQRIFEPFFTTKEAGKGTGLGLSTVHGIVKQHGGDISVYSEPGRGTTFRIYLPASAATQPAQREQPAPTQPPFRGGGSVLLAEDDAAVRDFVTAALSEYGYAVTSAASADAALAAAAQTGFDLVISDVVMPVMNGPELCRRIAELRPESRFLYISGYPAGTAALGGVLDADAPLLQKPFTVEALLLRARDVIEGRA
jgi:CheY-like chemotaxis protein